MMLSPRRFLFFSLLCAALVSLPFLPGLPGDFLVDDGPNILDNSGIRLQSLHPAALLDAAFSMQVGGATRTLPTLTFALDYYRAGLDPATFKTTNIAIHALTALMLAWFLRDLLLVAGVAPARARWAALAMALAWAVHPLQVSSVLYVVQRMQTLATLFLVLALWAYIRARRSQIEGRPGRTGWILTGLLWVIALGCKEDAMLLPAYLLALELTVLRFGAADPALARRLRRGYGLATALGTAAYLLVVVPHFWSWEAYAYRDFSSIERLLTQGRVLCLYLGQILLPMPSHMTFFYDWLQPSRGLLDPWTTLPAWLLVSALLALAWRFRRRLPLFSLGVLLFFAGHFITSNVINLELAFEHRNHFPLVGIVLAVADLLALATRRLQWRAVATVPACVLLLAAMAGATVVRARSWHSELELALTSARIAPDSGRAWQTLCVAHYELGGGGTSPDNPYLDKAIAACSRGAEVAPDSLTSLTIVIVLKAIQGSLAQADWNLYLDRIRHATMTPEDSSRIWVILNYVRLGVSMDDSQVLEAIDRFHGRVPFPAIESSAIGYFILGHTQQPDRAYPYFARAVQTTIDPSFAKGLINDLRKEGHPEWADRLQATRQATD